LYFIEREGGGGEKERARERTGEIEKERRIEEGSHWRSRSK